jgi:CBS domain-containing protein
MQRGRQHKRMMVKTWMGPPTHTLAPTERLDEALRHMRAHGVHHVLVVERGVPVGIVSERSLHDATPDHAIATVMVEVVSVEEDASVASASSLMVTHGVECLPVMRGADLVGLLTSTDLLRALAYTIDPEQAWAADAATP